jgi:ketosteroid isomerase-like protein
MVLSCNRRGLQLRPAVLAFLVLRVGGCFAQSTAIDPAARKYIDAGNRAWVDGMKTGNTDMIAATYATDALDCRPTGECEKGRAAIGEALKNRSAKLGRAQSASVQTVNSVQQGDFVYEWGSARATFEHDQKVEGRYLTVWRRMPDGSWKIFRNISIPPDQPK